MVQGQTRAWELTAESIFSQVLDELDADLALCGGERDVPRNPFYDRARFVWRMPEHDDWTRTYDELTGDSSWRALLHPRGHVFGEDTEGPTQRSSALLFCFRRLLREEMERNGLMDEYDWVIITRSDYLWPVPHPNTRYLSSRRIYALDGEQYGGVCDRHFAVPRRLLGRFLSLQDELFTDPEAVRRRLDRTMASEGWEWLNVERLLAARLEHLGLWRRLRYLPYVPFLVRAPDGPTAWSVGEYDEELGFYVKYPAERERSELGLAMISDQASWKRFLAPIRGARARGELRAAYRERGLFERALLPWHARARRRVRETFWPRARQRADRALARIGRVLRRIPGIPSLLDARLRRLQRVERDEGPVETR